MALEAGCPWPAECCHTPCHTHVPTPTDYIFNSCGSQWLALLLPQPPTQVGHMLLCHLRLGACCKKAHQVPSATGGEMAREVGCPWPAECCQISPMFLLTLSTTAVGRSGWPCFYFNPPSGGPYFITSGFIAAAVAAVAAKLIRSRVLLGRDCMGMGSRLSFASIVLSRPTHMPT